MVNIDELLDKKHSFAVIGASNNLEKYGAKIYEMVKRVGIEVYPVNNKEELIQGDSAYSEVAKLPKKADVLDFVVPPQVTLDITKQAYDLGYKIFWYQPGSFDQQVLDFHKDKDTEVISDHCLLVESSKLQ